MPFGIDLFTKKKSKGEEEEVMPSKSSTTQRDAATSERLAQLKKLQQNSSSNSSDRRRTVNVADSSGQVSAKKKGSNYREPSRSLFPAGKGSEKKSFKPAASKSAPKKVPYRIKGEKFLVYDYYQPIKILGHGAYAVVCEAKDLRNGQKVAIKKNKGVFQDISDAKRILREIKLLMHFNHDDVIKLLDIIPPEQDEINTFEEVYLVMPRMETTLARVIKSSQKLTKRHIQFFLYQMLRGMKYIHSSGVIHRDLKPENILINGGDCNLKITDFGLARGVYKEEEQKNLLTEYVVTRWYRAPEVMCSARMYDEKVDIWSVGCILAELLLRKPLFPGGNHIEQLKIIFKVLGTPTSDNLEWIKTPEAKKWVGSMKPNAGKDLNELFSMTTPDIRDILLNMLNLDPNARSSVAKLLEHQAVKELHNPAKEKTCPEFNIKFEFEASINTIFGVRHMMFEEFSNFSRMRNQKIAAKAAKKAKSPQ